MAAIGGFRAPALFGYSALFCTLTYLLFCLICYSAYKKPSFRWVYKRRFKGLAWFTAAYFGCRNVSCRILRVKDRSCANLKTANLA